MVALVFISGRKEVIRYWPSQSPSPELDLNDCVTGANLLVSSDGHFNDHCWLAFLLIPAFIFTFCFNFWYPFSSLPAVLINVMCNLQVLA